jgi:hypothetical protein
MRSPGFPARLNLSNVIAVLALLAAGLEAGVTALQVESYKKSALFTEQVRVCSTLVEGANEFRSAAMALRAANADQTAAAGTQLLTARDRLATNTRRIETALDALDLLGGSQTERQAAELARQADLHLLTLDQQGYTETQVQAWIDGFDTQVGRAVGACRKDLLR